MAYIFMTYIIMTYIVIAYGLYSYGPTAVTPLLDLWPTPPFSGRRRHGTRTFGAMADGEGRTGPRGAAGGKALDDDASIRLEF